MPLPPYCELCGALLLGGATIHKAACPWRALIAREFPDYKQPEPAPAARPVAFADFPAASYPIRVEALHPETRAVVWSQTIERPAPGAKGVLAIPPLRRQLGHRVAMRVTFADGQVLEESHTLVH